MISMRVTELLRLTTTSGRTYLIVNQLDAEGLEVIWSGFTPQGIFKAGIDMVTELMVKHRPAILIFNVLEHNTSDELQRYATAALLEYTKKQFMRTFSGQKFRRIIITNTIAPEDVEDQSQGYFVRLTEPRVETIYTSSISEAYEMAGLR
jgi:hypothetical protein